MRKMKILAHRGASGYAPENTMEAFELAVEQHADGFEIDIHITKDGEIVVIHDDTIDRTSNGTGHVTELTLAELQQFNYNVGFEANYPTAHIPTLAQVLELVKKHQLYLNIEIKNIMDSSNKYDGLNFAAAELVLEYEVEEQVIFSSFNHNSMRELKERFPNIKTALLHFSKLHEGEHYAKTAGADALHPLFSMIDKESIMESQAAGIQINAWTVNGRLDLEHMLKLGVDAVITDYPDVAYKIREGSHK